MTHHFDINTTPLRSGSHDSRTAGVCAMEAVAWLAGEPHSDRPACACPVLSAFVRSWNDALPDDETRSRLLGPVLQHLVGSRSSGAVEVARMWAILDWQIRVFLPAFLELNEALTPHAEAMRALPEQSSSAALDGSAAARAAARDAAWHAAGDAAWHAARAAARDAAWHAAWHAAGDAARAAARDAARAALAAPVATCQESAQALLIRLCAMAEDAS